MDQLRTHRAAPRRHAGVRTLSCAEQFRAMAFAQLTWRESLRDIEASLSANASKLHDVNVLDMLTFEAGAFYVMDRASLMRVDAYKGALDNLARSAVVRSIELARGRKSNR